MLVVHEVYLRPINFDMRSAGMVCTMYDVLDTGSVELINAKQRGGGDIGGVSADNRLRWNGLLGVAGRGRAESGWWADAAVS